jgi:hypothetical protein
MSSVIHETRPVQVWVDVDLDIADLVEYLNTIPGVRTFASCQGSIGEGGPHPYRAQIMAYWPKSVTPQIEALFEFGESGVGWTYLHPKKGGLMNIDPITTDGRNMIPVNPGNLPRP